MFATALLLLSACNFFELRDSEEPVKPTKWNEPCILHEQVIQNISYAYEDFQNWDKYESIFTEDFRFYFSPADINDYGISTIWGKDAERNSLYNLHNWASTMLIELDYIPQNDDIGVNDARIYRSYILRVYRNGNEIQYRGNFEIRLQKLNGIWKIKSWYDYRSGQQPTWGKLKYDISI